MGSAAGHRRYLCLVRAAAESILAVGGERDAGKRTYPETRSSLMRSPCLSSVEVFMREPLGGDATVCSIAVADPVPG